MPGKLFGAGPKPKVFDILRFTLTIPGPSPKLRGMIVSPGCGSGLKTPNLVTIAPGSPGWANEGRSVYWLSRLLSRPVVMLNGAPDIIVTKGLSRKPPGIAIEPPIKKLCRRSLPARPHSVDRSYGFAGF